MQFSGIIFVAKLHLGVKIKGAAVASCFDDNKSLNSMK